MMWDKKKVKVFNFALFLLHELKEREVRINFWHICKDLQKKKETGHTKAWQLCLLWLAEVWLRLLGARALLENRFKEPDVTWEKKISLIYAWRQTHHTFSVPHTSFFLLFDYDSASSHVLTALQSCCSIQVTCQQHDFLRQPLHCSNHAPLITLCLRRHAVLNRGTGAPVTKTECRAGHPRLPRDPTLACYA